MNKINKWFLLFILLSLLILSGCKKKEKIDPVDHIVLPESINFTSDAVEIYIGDTIDLPAYITPADALCSVKYYFSTETTCASLDGYTVTGTDIGTTVLRAETTDANGFKIYANIKISVLHELLNKEDNVVCNIVGAFGEDASHEYNIHFSTLNTTSYALITTADDIDFVNAKSYYGTGYYFEDLDEILSGPFEPRNVWQITATDLEANTSYIYKVNDGNDNYSDVYSFTTAGGDSTSFLFLTDVHYYMGTDGTLQSAVVSEETIKQAKEYDSNISFIVCGGDLIDTGGNDGIWSKWYEYAQSLKAYPFLSVPGNHEYYINGTGQRGNTYFAVNSAAPKNGAGDLSDSSCWFIHNQTLFILIDNIKNTSYTEQLAWMCDLLENQEYKYSVLVYHIPVHYNNTDYDQNYIDIIDKYAVDLVLDGHYHSQSICTSYYEAAWNADANLGTTYITGGAGGIKGSYTASDAILYASGYIVDITDEKISLQVIYANGRLGQKVDIYSTKNHPYEEIDDDKVLDSINYTYDETNSMVIFNWNSALYGNVKKIIVEDTLRGEISNYAILVNESYTSLKLKNIVKGYDYNFLVTCILDDGTTLSKEFYFSNHVSVNISEVFVYDTIAQLTYVGAEDDFKYVIGKVKVYVNGQFYYEFEYLENNIINKLVTFEDLDVNTTYNITLTFTDTHNVILFNETYAFTTEE